MPSQNLEISPSKHPPLATLSLLEARAVLKLAAYGDAIGLAEVIAQAECDAARADEILRDLAVAGYLRLEASRISGLVWRRTGQGNRLALEKLRKRIDRNRVDAAIATLTRRAEAINADPERLHRITLRLFGSALEQREDYGDVDVGISWRKRALSDDDGARIAGALAERQPPSAGRDLLGRLFAAERQDKREVRRALLQGLSCVSLMEDDPMELGTPFLQLVDHDLETDQPLAVSGAIVRPNVPDLREETPSASLPAASRIEARRRRLADAGKVPCADLLINFTDAALLEERLWTPAVADDGSLVANDLRHDPRMRFAGFQHLCPVWKRSIGGLEMLRQALEWCDARKVWVRDLAPMISILRSERTHVIRLGTTGWSGDPLVVEVKSTGPDAWLTPRTRTRVSRIDLAGAYATARALARIYSEARCAKAPHFTVNVWLPLTEDDRLPDMPRLIRAGKLPEGGFAGLVSAEIE